jgi:hypothetical protein
MKICLVGAELLHAESRRDMTELIVAFRNFTEAPKSGSMAGSVCEMIGYWQHCRGQLCNKMSVLDFPLSKTAYNISVFKDFFNV